MTRAYGLPYDRLGREPWLQEQPTLARCSFCPDLLFEGTAAEASAWGAAHHASAHPGLRDRGQLVRQRAAKGKQ